MPASKKWTKVEIHNSLIEKVDSLVSNGLQPSRQSAVNHFVRRGLEISETQLYYKDLFDTIINRLNQIEKIIEKQNLESRRID